MNIYVTQQARLGSCFYVMRTGIAVAILDPRRRPSVRRGTQHISYSIISMVKQRRSKRKVTTATRFSARKQAQIQQETALYGSDYGILPSGEWSGVERSRGV